jgi:hypothetical protein
MHDMLSIHEPYANQCFMVYVLRMLCLHMFAQHVVLVGFVVIVVISLTLWMLRYICGYT